MIKCKYCGHSLNIEQGFCSYCGNRNEYFQKHREDMDEYKREFRNTQVGLYRKTNRITTTTIYMLVICVIIILNIIVSTINKKAYYIASEISSGKVWENADRHNEILGELVNEENYIGVSEYYNQNNLYGCDEVHEYYYIKVLANEYSTIYASLMDTQIGYKSREDFNYDIKTISSAVTNMIEMLNEDSLFGKHYIENREIMDGIFEETKDLLRVYGNLSHEQINELDTYSETKIITILEEGIPYNEKE